MLTSHSPKLFKGIENNPEAIAKARIAGVDPNCNFLGEAINLISKEDDALEVVKAFCEPIKFIQSKSETKDAGKNTDKIIRFKKEGFKLPILEATLKNFPKVLNYLLNLQPDLLNERLNFGFTASYIAAVRGHCECLEVLKQRKADFNKAIKLADAEVTPLQALIRGEKIGEDKKLQVVKILIEGGADVNLPDDYDHPLALAARRGKYDLVNVLIGESRKRFKDKPDDRFIHLALFFAVKKINERTENRSENKPPENRSDFLKMIVRLLAEVKDLTRNPFVLGDGDISKHNSDPQVHNLILLEQERRNQNYEVRKKAEAHYKALREKEIVRLKELDSKLEPDSESSQRTVMIGTRVTVLHTVQSKVSVVKNPKNLKVKETKSQMANSQTQSGQLTDSLVRDILSKDPSDMTNTGVPATKADQRLLEVVRLIENVDAKEMNSKALVRIFNSIIDYLVRQATWHKDTTSIFFSLVNHLKKTNAFDVLITKDDNGLTPLECALNGSNPAARDAVVQCLLRYAPDTQRNLVKNHELLELISNRCSVDLFDLLFVFQTDYFKKLAHDKQAQRLVCAKLVFDWLSGNPLVDKQGTVVSANALDFLEVVKADTTGAFQPLRKVTGNENRFAGLLQGLLNTAPAEVEKAKSESKDIESKETIATLNPKAAGILIVLKDQWKLVHQYLLNRDPNNPIFKMLSVHPDNMAKAEQKAKEKAESKAVKSDYASMESLAKLSTVVKPQVADAPKQDHYGSVLVLPVTTSHPASASKQLGEAENLGLELTVLNIQPPNDTSQAAVARP